MLSGELEPGGIVIDNGSAMIRAGFSGKTSPYAVFPSIVCRDDSRNNRMYVGDDAVLRRDFLSLKSPIQQGVVQSWDEIQEIWSHIFDHVLYVNPQEYPILLTESPMNPKANREKMIEIMFETYSVPAMYAAIPAVLALLASGRITGVVLDSGRDVSHVVPIYEGYAVPRALEQIGVAGQHVTEYIIKLIHDSGYDYTSTAKRDVVREIKEKLAYVPLDFDAEMKKINSTVVGGKSFKLPDGRVLSIDDQRLLVRSPELLFNPSMASPEVPSTTRAVGVHEAIHNAITKVGVDTRSACYSNIVLSGGSTCFPGMQPRLVKEMTALAPASAKVEVEAPPAREYTAWLGGSILSALQIPTGWIYMEEYEDSGHSIIHRKCI